MNTVDSENLPEILQNIYQKLSIDADDLGMAYDEVLQYVEEFEMDEDMLFSFIKEKLGEKKEKDKGRDMIESLRKSLKDVMI